MPKPTKPTPQKTVIKKATPKAAVKTTTPPAVHVTVTPVVTTPAAITSAPASSPVTVAAPMLTLFVDGIETIVPKGSTVMQAARLAEKEIPYFCYHERLSVAGNCRMCLVELEGMPKPVASCHWPAAEGMKILTKSPMTIAARKGTMEFLLINHPLDCPICDQGGECDLQDEAVAYGADRGNFNEFKRAVDDKDIGAKIKTVMTRCIHCTRCVRFATEVAGVEEFGATGRGETMQIGTYVEQALQSELAGNMIDLCPVGALTSRPYTFTARPWELIETPGVDILDAIGTPLRVHSRAGQVMRVLPAENAAINEEWLTDTARFSYDALTHNRLTSPRLRKGPKDKAGVQYSVGWPEVFTKLTEALKGLAGDKTAGLLGNLQSAEDIFSFHQFITTTLASANLAGHAGQGVTAGQREKYTLNQPLTAFETTDAVLLVGCNPRLEAPLLNVRLRRAALKRRVPIAHLGAPVDLTYPHAELGAAPQLLADLAAGKGAFHEILKNATQPTILLPLALFSRPDGAALYALAQQLATKTGATLSVLAATPGEVTALDLTTPPLENHQTTSAILKAWQVGSLKVLFVYGDGGLVPTDLIKQKNDQTLVYLGTHLSPVAEVADIVLPTAAWSEKNGLYANAEGRVQESILATLPPLHAKEDWKIFRALSGELGRPLPFDTFAQLRTLIAAAHPAYAPANRNLVLPTESATPIKPANLALSSTPLASALTPQNYYLSTGYHRQSATLHACQAEQGLARVNPGSDKTVPHPGNLAHKPVVHAPQRRANHGATQGIDRLPVELGGEVSLKTQTHREGA